MTELKKAKLFRGLFILIVLYAIFSYIFKKDALPFVLMSAGYTCASIEMASREKIERLKQIEELKKLGQATYDD